MKLSIVAFTVLVFCTGCLCEVPATTKEPETTLQPANPVKRIQLHIEPPEHSMKASLQSAIPAKRILLNGEPPEHSLPKTTLQPANPAKRTQLLDWLKNGIHKRETNCPEGVSLCSTSQTCCRSANNKWFACCPMTNAVCCPDGIYCCPATWNCGKGYCWK